VSLPKLLKDGAGDRVRTGDVQLGKLLFVVAWVAWRLLAEKKSEVMTALHFWMFPRIAGEPVGNDPRRIIIHALSRP
jgi:hypothetical protein